MKKLISIGSNLSLSQRAYENIKEAIILNRFKPFEILTEEKLAEELEISRTPVRSALKKLLFENLIIKEKSSRSMMVSEVTEKDVKEVSVVRINLGTLSVREIENSITDDQIENLENLLFIQDQAATEKDYIKFIEMEYKFHTLIARYTNNKFISEMIDKIETTVQRYLILSNSLNKHSVVANNEHKQILARIKKREFGTAADLMEKHIKASTERMFK